MSAFASLHSGLLVRKGQAAPSVHPPVPPVLAPLPTAPVDRCAVERRDAEASSDNRPRLRVLAKPVQKPTSEPSPSSVQTAPALALAPAPQTSAPAADDGFVRIELRLRADQARRLSIAAARLGRRRGVIATDALEAYLTVLGEGMLKGCGCFTGASAAGDCCAR